MIKKVLFLTPPLKAWDSHGLHKAANQMHAQVAAYIRLFESLLRDGRPAPSP